MRVHIQYVSGAYLREYEKSYVAEFSREIFSTGGNCEFEMAPIAAEADLIILWEGFEYKTPNYIALLENEPLIRRHAERVYVINYDDHPEGFLAGVYTSLEDPFFKPEFHASWPFYLMNNRRVYDLTSADINKVVPTRLFSFRGAASHEVRRKIFELYSGLTSRHLVEHVKKWYDHGDEDRLAFARVALDSMFCLCPHGYSAYTPRIAEIMAMGRVPVVIADGWIPFSFPEEIVYYIKVAEADIPRIPEILESRRSEAAEIGRNARLLWEKYCSPRRRATAVVEAIMRLARRSGARPTFDDYRDRWHSREFLRQLGWTWPQRLGLRVEQHARRHFPNARIPGVTPLMRYRNAPSMKDG